MSDRDLRNLYENVRRGDVYHAPDYITNVYSKVINEMSFMPIDQEDQDRSDYGRTPQPVDFQVSVKEFIQNIQELAKSGLLSAEDISFFNKRMTEKPFREKIIGHLSSSNINDETMATINVPEAIFTYVSNRDCFKQFVNYIDSPLTLSNIPGSGNMFSIFSKTKLPSEFILDLIELNGMEGGRGVGKGELFLSCMFSDVQQSGDESAGDCTWNGQYLEVKGTGARLGGRDDNIDQLPKDIVDTLVQTEFGNKLLDEHAAKSKGQTYSSGAAIGDIIQNVWQFAQAIDKREKSDYATSKALNSIQAMMSICYPKTGIKCDPNQWDWNEKNWSKSVSSNGLRAMLTSMYVDNYVRKHDIAFMCLINTHRDKKHVASGSYPKTYGTYHIFPASKVLDVAMNNPGMTGHVKTRQLGPSLNSIKAA